VTETTAGGSTPPAALLPGGKSPYRLLTGRDDHHFCLRVSEALAQGWRLYGSPAITFNGEYCVAAQAVIWKDAAH
jgi:hypothetical protein